MSLVKSVRLNSSVDVGGDGAVYSVNLLPCRIRFNGYVDGKVSAFWPVDRGSGMAFFRGRKLCSIDLLIPRDYIGGLYVYKDNNSAEMDCVAVIQKIVSWVHQRETPSIAKSESNFICQDASLIKDWIDFTSAVHEY